jgi:hypothetical protein
MMALFALVIAVSFIHQGVFASTWYVSVSGSEGKTCGKTETSACSSLEQVIKTVQDGDIIHINAQGTKKKPLTLCSTEPISKSFSMLGYNGYPSVQCLDKSAPYIIRLADPNMVNNTRKINVKMDNINFVQGFIHVTDINLYVHNCSFVRSSISVGSVEWHKMKVTNEVLESDSEPQIATKYLCSSTKLVLNYTSFSAVKSKSDKLIDILQSPYDIMMRCDHSVLMLINSSVTGRRVHVTPGVKGGLLFVNKTKLLGDKSSNRYGGLKVVSPVKTKVKFAPFSIRIVSSLIKDHTRDNKMVPILYEHLAIQDAAVYVRTDAMVTLQVVDSAFVGNDRAIAMQYTGGHAIIFSSAFKNNSAMFDGSAILVIPNPAKDSSVKILKCLFANNKAGQQKFDMNKRSHKWALSTKESSGIIQTEFEVNTQLAQGRFAHVVKERKAGSKELISNYASQGYGGAIYIYGKDMIDKRIKTSIAIMKTAFTGNTATMGGGHWSSRTH